MEYNTSRNRLLMPEYGRNIQKMVDHIMTIEDKELRQKNADYIIELMGILNPHLKNVDDFKHKLWDHIFQISDFKIDIETPYEMPSREKLNQKPDPLTYPVRNLKNRHIGKNITKIIEKAIASEEEGKHKGYVNSIAYYMKLSYANWHKEQVQDEVIQQELKALSKGVLDYSPGDIRTPKFNTSAKKHTQGNQNKGRTNPTKSRNSSSNYQGKSNRPSGGRTNSQKNG